MLQLALTMHSFYLRNVLYLVGSVCAWLVFSAAYSYAYQVSHIAALSDFSGVGIHLLGEPVFWLSIPVIVVASMLTDIVGASVSRFFFTPSLVDTVVQEYDRGYGSGEGFESFSQKVSAVTQAQAPREVGKLNLNNVEMDSAEHNFWCDQLKSYTAKISDSLPTAQRSSAAMFRASPPVKIAPMSQRFIRQPLLEEDFTQNWLISKSVKVRGSTRVVCLGRGTPGWNSQFVRPAPRWLRAFLPPLPAVDQVLVDCGPDAGCHLHDD